MDTLVSDRRADPNMSPEQREYIAGLFAGVAARGSRFSDVEPAPPSADEELIFEEQVKQDLHPLDAYTRLLEHAAENKAPDKEDLFRFKWNGLFFLTPVKSAFMARLRIPGGVLKSFQLRELARVAQELTTGYVQITTRANLQIRLIEPKNAPEVLRRIQAVGLHTRGAGADNIRNLTANPTAGIDPVEVIDTLPYLYELAQIIVNDRSFYDLPRKFNIAFDGGGLIGSVEDTNDIGLKAYREGNDILFRVALGGATGHKAFARDVGVAVPASDVVRVTCALVRVYIAHGCRTDRKKARLKHLLEKMSIDEFLKETEQLLGTPLRRSAIDPATMRWASQELKHSHVGDYPQKQRGLNYVGATLPAGQITPKQMSRIAELSEAYGSGEVRLTVWQNFILPNIPDAFVPTVKRALEKIGLSTRQSNVSSGLIACTGNSYCKFAQANTKQHALDLVKFLEKKVSLDQPVNIHLTGCPNSCAQHYIGDIGCLGTKAKLAGESLDAYHVFVGGGFGRHQDIGRQLFTGVIASELPKTLERILLVYMQRRTGKESFQDFTRRHDLRQLQELFSATL